MLPSGAEQSYPIGWTGRVQDAIGAAWVEHGLARDVSPAAVPTLTPEQTLALKAAADQILAETAALAKAEAEKAAAELAAKAEADKAAAKAAKAKA